MKVYLCQRIIIRIRITNRKTEQIGIQKIEWTHPSSFTTSIKHALRWLKERTWGHTTMRTVRYKTLHGHWLDQSVLLNYLYCSKAISNISTIFIKRSMILSIELEKRNQIVFMESEKRPQIIKMIFNKSNKKRNTILNWSYSAKVQLSNLHGILFFFLGMFNWQVFLYKLRS